MEPDLFDIHGITPETQSPMGWEGVGQDIKQSLETLPSAFWEFAQTLPSETYGVGQQLVHDPDRLLRNAMLGLMRSGRGIVNIPSMTYNYLTEKGLNSGQNPYINIGQTRPEEILIEKLGATQPGDVLSEGLGGFGPFGAIGKGAKGIAGLGKRAGAGATYGVANESNPIHAALMQPAFELGAKGIGKINERLPLAPTAAAALITGAGGLADIPYWLTAPIGATAGFYLNRGFNPSKYAKSEVFPHLSQERIAPIIEASERLGLPFVTPAEASRTHYHGTKGGHYGTTGEASNIYTSKLEARSEAGKGLINNLLDSIFDKKIDEPRVKEMYAQVNPVKVPNKTITHNFANDPVMMEALAAVEKEPGYQRKFKNVPKDTVEYWDLVRDALYDLEAKKQEHGKATSLSREYAQVRTALTKALDELVPDYQKARQLKEAEHTRADIDKIFYPSGKSLSIKDMGRALLNDKTYENIIFHLRNRPELQQVVTDMRTVFPELIEAHKHKTAEFGQRTHVHQPRTVPEYLDELHKKLVGQEFETAIVDLVTSPEWPRILREYQANQAKSLMSQATQGFVNMLPMSALNKEARKREPDLFDIHGVSP